MPTPLAQLLTENKPAYPTAGATFGESCSQLRRLGLSLDPAHTSDPQWTYQRVEHVKQTLLHRDPKLGGMGDKLKKLVNHPLALQMACQSQVMISVWTRHVEGIVGGITQDGMGACLAHTWLSLELLLSVSLSWAS